MNEEIIVRVCFMHLISALIRILCMNEFFIHPSGLKVPKYYVDLYLNEFCNCRIPPKLEIGSLDDEMHQSMVSPNHWKIDP